MLKLFFFQDLLEPFWRLQVKVRRIWKTRKN